MRKLNTGDYTFHPLSVMDRSGRVFRWNGMIYRAISKEFSSFYLELFKEGIIEQLVNSNLLVETEVAPLEIDHYALVLKHRTLPFISYSHEWCDEMYKDAALLHIDLAIALGKYHLTIKDASALNVIFDGSKATFIDFCSIVRTEDGFFWPGETYDRFRSIFINPLYLIERGCRNFSLSLLRDNQYTQTEDLKYEFKALYSQDPMKFRIEELSSKIIQFARRNTPGIIRPISKEIFREVKKKKRALAQNNYLQFLQVVRQEVEQITLPSLKASSRNCYDNFFGSFSSSKQWTEKQESVHKILSMTQPKTVLDSDANRGWYAQLAARCGSQVVAFDSDEAHVRKVYQDAKDNNLPITPLLIDFSSQMFDFHNDCFESIYKRLRCEMVISLTLFQHILLNRHITLDKALERLLNLSDRWLLLEFIPRQDLATMIPSEDQFSRERWVASPWYTLDEFTSILKTYFETVRCFSSYPEGRSLMLCEK